MSETTTRKLATIVALDVAGYSARTETDEARTTAEITALRNVIEAITSRHGGRIFNTAGDGFMLEFTSSLSAVEAAFELAETCDPKVRVGVHVGDVVPQPNGDLLGHGVNVAARLMAQSTPGSALVSADVKRMIRGPISDRLQSRGTLKLDKMTETIEAFAFSSVTSTIHTALPTSEPVLAVLPFDNLSDDREMQFFSDGISEEILQTVARAKNIKVIGRSSSFQFRGPDKAVRKVAGELRVTHILDGSVRRAGSRIRVSAHLVEASSQTTLWTDRYDRELTDVLNIQDELAVAIADALNASLPHKPAAHAVDPEAFDCYLRARAVLAGNWIETEKRYAVALLERATSLSPSFGRAWGVLAFARTTLLSMETDTGNEPGHLAAEEAANRALALDPNCPEAFAALMTLKPAFSDYAEKTRLADRSVELAPNDAFMVGYRGELLMSLGRAQECITAYERCVLLEPTPPMFHAGLAIYLLSKHRFAESSKIIDVQLQHLPDSPLLWRIRWVIAFTSGHRDDAEKMLLPGAPLPIGVSRADANTALELLTMLRMSAADRVAALRTALSAQTGPVLQLNTCLAAAEVGETDLAFAELFAALDSNRPIGNRGLGPFGHRRAATSAVLFLPYADALRHDPRFPSLCHRLGLVDYWRSSGHWPDCATEVPYDFRAECEKIARGTP